MTEAAATDPFDLQRFVDAQGNGTYERAVAELRDGHKTTHWMWFVFPQVAGLGRSDTAVRFAISGRDEAAAYLAHPVLGPRLAECAAILADARGTATDVLGEVDAQKLRSSVTLFAEVADDPAPFRAVLDRHFAGLADQATLDRL
ncbi:DUF1810 domain-containing protein [Aeromicrobium chenweiae]|uniref:DUF1810 domain-containing protein n=1 Tax=Aeromicrobium chenweiae TaxID=2079793 RepID=A0A2S0WPB8_9ACTN|nr:DUF1810 domain-containing protein [Aeromicrobium chenweiae]AWB93185.1 DUF1810 domain-containing protein [Aeromicrobium chenweiae]TGN34175.1 DUF1810 domain-containing protein [Aeromicrobium chenweiae]